MSRSPLDLAPTRPAPPIPGSARRGRHAVVVGGGIGGLLSTLALRGRFDRITVVERDRYPDHPGARKGVSQSRCLHLLMAGGALAFEKIVPGFAADLTAAGARAFDFGEQAALRFSQGWLPRFHAGINVHACSRGLLESVLRRRAAEDSTLRILEGQSVTGLLADGAGARVRGVRCGGRRGAREDVLEADLTVIAGGRGSALPRWLEALGVPPSDQTSIDSDLHYTSRWFAIPEAFQGDWRVLSIAPAPGGARRSGMIFEAEQRRWGVVLLGPRDEEAPISGEDFLAFARSLADARLHDAIAAARPVSPVFRYARSRNRIHHHERNPRWPDGLVALGDAVCELDPYFGLGMTACARGVVELMNPAVGGLDAVGAARRFQARLAEINEAPWRVATQRDGDGAIAARDAPALQCLQRLAPWSPELSRVLLERMHLVSSPDAILSPAVVELVRAEIGRGAAIGSSSGLEHRETS